MKSSHPPAYRTLAPTAGVPLTLRTAKSAVCSSALPPSSCGRARRRAAQSDHDEGLRPTIGYGHTFTVVFGCEASLSATGYQNVHNPDETITATLSPDGTYVNIIL